MQFMQTMYEENKNKTKQNKKTKVIKIKSLFGTASPISNSPTC